MGISCVLIGQLLLAINLYLDSASNENVTDGIVGCSLVLGVAAYTVERVGRMSSLGRTVTNAGEVACKHVLLNRLSFGSSRTFCEYGIVDTSTSQWI